MRINLKKTKVMMFTKGQPRKVSIWIRNTELEQVHEFCYLESLLTEDARCDKEIKKRIAMAKAAFMKRITTREHLKGLEETDGESTSMV